MNFILHCIFFFTLLLGSLELNLQTISDSYGVINDVHLCANHTTSIIFLCMLLFDPMFLIYLFVLNVCS